MITVEEALGRILASVERLPAEARALLDALGQVLVEDVRATFDSPPYDNAAMDGYAVRHADVAAASPHRPVELRVVEEVPAGSTPRRSVEAGCAIRIMTGAPLPAGADTVVPFEDTDERAVLDRSTLMPEGGRAAPAGAAPRRERVLVERPPRAGANVRRRGEDMAEGDLIIAAGAPLRPAELGVLAALGRATVSVVRRPRVAILSTGDELVPPGEPLRPGQIYDANSTALAALVLRYGGVPVELGIAPDTAEDLVRRVRLGAACDLLITSAGVSKGDYDMVKEVLAAEGEVTFWQVAMKPARPLAFGRIGTTPLIGLPGNPVSSMVAFEQFCRPAILKLLGYRQLAKPEITATLTETVRNTDGRRVYLRARVARDGDRYLAALTGPQGSGILTSMVRANALVIIPDGVMEIPAGAEVRAQMLDWPADTLM